MTKENIKKLVKDSKGSIQREFDGSVQSIKDEINNLKKSTVDKI